LAWAVVIFYNLKLQIARLRGPANSATQSQFRIHTFPLFTEIGKVWRFGMPPMTPTYNPSPEKHGIMFDYTMQMHRFSLPIVNLPSSEYPISPPKNKMLTHDRVSNVSFGKQRRKGKYPNTGLLFPHLKNEQTPS
jgi:hypothetical protein